MWNLALGGNDSDGVKIGTFVICRGYRTLKIEFYIFFYFFCEKLLPMAKVFGGFSGRLVQFDPFISRLAFVWGVLSFAL